MTWREDNGTVTDRTLLSLSDSRLSIAYREQDKSDNISKEASDNRENG